MGRYLFGYNKNLADNENFELCSPTSKICVFTNKYTYFKNYKALKTVIQSHGMAASFYISKDLFFTMLIKIIKENLNYSQIQKLYKVYNRYGDVNGIDVKTKHSISALKYKRNNNL